MNQDDFNKLQQARDLIKSKQYTQARKILITIKDNPTARQWLIKLDEKELFEVPIKPTIPTKSQIGTSLLTGKTTLNKISTPLPVANATKTKSAKRKFSLMKLILMLVGLVAVAFLTLLIYSDIQWRGLAYEKLPQAKAVMRVFCEFSLGYSETICVVYANEYFNQSIYRVHTVTFCNQLYSLANADSFARCLDDDLVLPSQILD